MERLRLQPDGEDHLLHLPLEGALRLQEEVLGELLGDRRAALDDAAGLEVGRSARGRGRSGRCRNASRSAGPRWRSPPPAGRAASRRGSGFAALSPRLVMSAPFSARMCTFAGRLGTVHSDGRRELGERSSRRPRRGRGRRRRHQPPTSGRRRARTRRCRRKGHDASAGGLFFCHRAGVPVPVTHAEIQAPVGRVIASETGIAPIRSASDASP